MRVMLVGGTGPVGQSAVPMLLAAGHEVAVAHSGEHEPPELPDVQHVHGSRAHLLGPGGPAERWRPEVIVDSFPGGATAAKARELGDLALRGGARHVIAISSIDVYRHCVLAGVDDHEPVELPIDPLPLREDAVRRTEASPEHGAWHYNVAMEDALHGADRLTVLRPGAIYGPYLHPRVLREWYLVGKVARGEHRLELPAGGTQLFHRVAVERLSEAIGAAIDRAPVGRWECNVADSDQLTFGALARLVAERLDWTWEPEDVAWSDGDHPWNVRHPVVADTTRLRTVLGVQGPGTVVTTSAQIDWLWGNRKQVEPLVGSFEAGR